MVMCVEVLASPEGGDFSIKLEDQVLITAEGYENLTKYPFDPRLMDKGQEIKGLSYARENSQICRDEGW